MSDPYTEIGGDPPRWVAMLLWALIILATPIWLLFAVVAGIRESLRNRTRTSHGGDRAPYYYDGSGG